MITQLVLNMSYMSVFFYFFFFFQAEDGIRDYKVTGVQTCALPISFTTPADFFAGMDPRFGTFSIPLLFRDTVHAEKVLLDPAMNKEILALGAKDRKSVV